MDYSLCPWNSPGKNTGVGCHSLLQGIFLTRGWNLGILHCRWILCIWAPRGAIISHRSWVEDCCSPEYSCSSLDAIRVHPRAIWSTVHQKDLLVGTDALQCALSISIVTSGCKRQLHLCRNLWALCLSGQRWKWKEREKGLCTCGACWGLTWLVPTLFLLSGCQGFKDIVKEQVRVAMSTAGQKEDPVVPVKE